MMTSSVVLNTQMYNIKLRSSILKIKSGAQKKMVESGFERRFHDLNYFEVDFFPFTFLEFITYSRASSQNFVGNHQFKVLLLYFKEFSDIHDVFLFPINLVAPLVNWNKAHTRIDYENTFFPT